MATIEDFILRFKTQGTENLNKAATAVEGLGNTISQFGADIGPIGDAITSLSGRLGPLGVAAGAVGVAFVGLGAYALNVARDLQNISDASGIAASQLKNLQSSVLAAGGSADLFGDIATDLNKNLKDAAAGNGDLQDAFRTLGVFVTDANGKVRNTGDVLIDLVTKFRSGQLSVEEYNASLKLLGEEAKKLDLSKLSATRDAVTDAEIQKLKEYAAAIDRVKAAASAQVVSFFGQMVLDIDEAIKKNKELEAELNRTGRTRIFGSAPDVVGGIVGLERSGPPLITRPMTSAERARYQAEQIAESGKSEAANELARLQGRLPATATAGGFGAESEEEKRKREAEAKRLADEARRAAEELEKQKQTILDISAGYERMLSNNVKRYQTEVDLLGKTAEEADLARGRNEIERRYSEEVAKMEAKKATAKGSNLTLIEQTIEKLKTSEQSEIAAFEASKLKTQEYARQEALLKKTRDLQDIILGLSRDQADAIFAGQQTSRSPLEQQIATIQRDAERAAEAAGRAFEKSFGDAPKTQAQVELITRGQKAINDGYKAIAQTQLENLMSSRTWESGWERAFKTYADEASNSAKMAERVFAKATQGMEDAIVDFAKTGKFEWKGFVASLAEELLRSQIRQLFAQVFGGSGGGGGNSGSTILSTIASVGKLLGFANGGIIPTNGPVIVGERGPELLTGAAGRTVVPNHQLGGTTVVNYNISAVDAMSFKQMVARDPEFIHAVASQGARAFPQTRR